MSEHGDAVEDAAKKAVPWVDQVKQALADGGWEDVEITHLGEQALNYGRFPVDTFAPSIAFSFAVARKA